MWLRLRQIALVVRDIETVFDDLHAVLGLEVGYSEETMPGSAIGMENRVMPIGTQFLELVSPVRDGVTGQRYIERRGGDGGYMVILQCDDAAARDARVKELGIRTVSEDNRPGVVSMLQLHPKDTGGSFLEVDWHVGHDKPNAPWSHAVGTDWEKAIRTDVVDAIVAAEVQAPAPREVAERWSEVLQAPLTTDAAGNPALALDGSIVRFVEDRDGRGEGLGGIDLRATNAHRALKAAEVRGLRAGDDTVLIGGTRMRLVEA